MASFSKTVRRVHMYSALFLTPWMIIYAASGLVLNHNQLVRSWYAGGVGVMEKVDERPYPTTFSADADARLVAGQILEDLNLRGSFGVQGTLASPKLTINRNAGFAQHRVTYFPAEKRLLVEKQTFTLPVFLNRAHFRHGYEQPFFAAKVWAVVLDAVIVAMLFWAVSGVIMWWDIRPARMAGFACIVGSFALFAVLLVAS